MTQGPDDPTQPQQPYGAPPPPPPYGQPSPAGYPVPPSGAYGVSSTTPYGIHPVTGIPYSDKSKLIAGLLQILIPIGIGRFYIGDNKTGILQLLLVFVCGIGALWAFIDGIVMLATDSKDANGYMLRS